MPGRKLNRTGRKFVLVETTLFDGGSVSVLSGLDDPHVGSRRGPKGYDEAGSFEVGPRFIRLARVKRAPALRSLKLAARILFEFSIFFKMESVFGGGNISIGLIIFSIDLLISADGSFNFVSNSLIMCDFNVDFEDLEKY